MRQSILLVTLLLSTIFLDLRPIQAGSAALTFNVDSTADEPDATPGDGSCAGCVAKIQYAS